ncbi:MAG: AsnC family transcriptional regulator [archaeon]
MSYTLDKIDKKILFYLEKNSRIADVKLAKLVNRSKESVRYRIRQLINEKVITGFSIILDPTRFGYQPYKLYLNLTNIPSKKKEFLEYLKKEKSLMWLGVADGAWDIGLTFFKKNNLDFYSLENRISSEYNDLILRKSTGVVVDVISYSKNFFVEKAEYDTNILFGESSNLELDILDKQIIQILFNNSRETYTQIARETKSTVDIIRNRIRKLEDNKIIAQYRTNIDFNLLGYEFYKTFLYLKKISVADQKNLIEYCMKNPNVVYLVRQISQWNMELEIIVKSYHEYNILINDLREKFSEIIENIESAIMSQDYIYPAKNFF